PVAGSMKPAAGSVKSVGGYVISDKGTYTVRRTFPPRFPCKVDADCSQSRFAPGRCCMTPCPQDRVGGTVAWVEAVKKQWKEVCASWHKKNRYTCPYPKCDSNGWPVAKCVSGKCTISYKN
ncbi:hypothetical protein KJ865_05710, partial [Myxococcota bacterium]|nr:hypothetical protein [Myxococcota bacterium]